MVQTCRSLPGVCLKFVAALGLCLALGAPRPAPAAAASTTTTLAVRAYQIHEQDGPRIKSLIDAALPVARSTAPALQRRLLVNRDALVIRDTPANLRHIEDLLLDWNFIKLLRRDALDIAYFNLAPDRMDADSINEQIRYFNARIVEMIEVFLYSPEGKAAAAAQGRRLWFNPYTLELVIVDFPANLARVRGFVESLARPTAPPPARRKMNGSRPPAGAAPAQYPPAVAELLGRQLLLPEQAYLALPEFMEALARAIPQGLKYNIAPGSGGSIFLPARRGTLRQFLDMTLRSDRSWSVDAQGVIVIEPRPIVKTYTLAPAQAPKIRALLDSGALQQTAWGQTLPPSPKFFIRLDGHANTLEVAAASRQSRDIEVLLATIPPPAAPPEPQVPVVPLAAPGDPRLVERIASLLAAPLPSTTGFQRKIAIDRDLLLIQDTPENLRKIEAGLTAQKLIQGGEPPRLDAAIYSLAPGGILSYTPQTLDFFSWVQDCLNVLLYTEDGIERALAQGRRLWLDPATLQLTLIDTPGRVARVSRFLAGLAENLPPPLHPARPPLPTPGTPASHVIFVGENIKAQELYPRLQERITPRPAARAGSMTGTQPLPEVTVDLLAGVNALRVNYRHLQDLAAVKDILRHLDHGKADLHFEAFIIRTVTTSTQDSAPAFDPVREWGATLRAFSCQKGGGPPAPVQCPVIPPTAPVLARLYTLDNLGRLALVFTTASEALSGREEILSESRRGPGALILRLTPQRESGGRIHFRNLSLERIPTARGSTRPGANRSFDITLREGETLVLTHPDFPGYSILLSGRLLE